MKMPTLVPLPDLSTRIPDIFFSPRYAAAYNEAENAKEEVFHFDDAEGEIYMLFLRRRLTEFPGFESYSDATTPYGYGGPLILNGAGSVPARAGLAKRFAAAYNAYCCREGIVSTFFRFHPIIDNGPDFMAAFDHVEAIHPVVAINLSNHVEANYHANLRHKLRTAVKKGVTVSYDTCGDTLNDFLDIYYMTMDKKSAADYYYFSRRYFENLMGQFPKNTAIVNAKREGETVASLFLMYYGDFVHSHLGGTRKECYPYEGFSAIHDDVARRFAREGYKWFILGGGHTDAPDDGLLRYKKCYTADGGLFPFYTGRKIHLPNIYDTLCRQRHAAIEPEAGTLPDPSFFPFYRAKL